MSDDFGNDERDIRLVAVAAHARGDYAAERIALDRLAQMERAQKEQPSKTVLGEPLTPETR